MVVRTAYGDDEAWGIVRDLLLAAASQDPYIGVHFIDDLEWVGASVDEVLEASRSDPHCSVVFIADALTMEATHHALPAVNTGTHSRQ
ncbi:DUF6924 domain-containing protein [Actinospica sp.]|uniref:DUF6924 domain-containing protein n=1 Tax=Actinospica sp. TaxID=1872142 RepID=UPI0039C86C3A